jgi:hypothetical protein
VIVESASIGVPEAKVALDLRIENRSDYDDFLAPSDIQLVADGRALSPNETDGLYLSARTTSKLALDYDVSGAPADLVLLVHHWAQEGRIPLVGPSVISAEPPAVATAPETISVAAATMVIGPAAIEVLSDRFLVGVPIALTNTTRYPIPFFADAFRLQVDGASQAPVEFVNEVVEPNATREATIVWEAPLDAGELVLAIDYEGNTAEVHLT